MPLVRIDRRRGKPAAYKQATADGVYCTLLIENLVTTVV
jgi:hypothetical protein